MANIPATYITFALAIISFIYLCCLIAWGRRRTNASLAAFFVFHNILYFLFYFVTTFPVISPTVAMWNAGLKIHGILTVILMTVDLRGLYKHGLY